MFKHQDHCCPNKYSLIRILEIEIIFIPFLYSVNVLWLLQLKWNNKKQLFTHFLHTFYTLFTHFLHTFYTLFTHFLHTFYFYQISSLDVVASVASQSFINCLRWFIARTGCSRLKKHKLL